MDRPRRKARPSQPQSSLSHPRFSLGKRLRVVDTSAILAIYFDEPASDWVATQLELAPRRVMSRVNLTECLIVLLDRDPGGQRDFRNRLLGEKLEWIPPDTEQAVLAAEARLKFPLNLGDCFAYALAKQRRLPLLTLDRDFRNLDIEVVRPE